MLTTKKEKKLLLLACLIFVLNAFLVILSTDRIAAVIDCAEKRNTESFLYLMWMAVTIVVGEKVTAVLMTVVSQRYVSKSDITVKENIMKSILHRPFYRFRMKEDAYYINLLTTDATIHRDNYLGSIPWIAYFTAYGIFALAMLLRINLILGIAVLGVSAIPVLLEKILAKLVEKRNQEYSALSEAWMRITKETIECCKVIRMNEAETAFQERYNLCTENQRKSCANKIVAESISQQALYTSASILRLLTLGLGAYFVIKGLFSAAMLFAAMNYAINLSNSFSNISYYSISIKSSRKVTARLKGEMLVDKSDDGQLDIASGPIEVLYKDFSFGFGDKLLFDKFNFRFERGKCYAIIGESGRGKTTLLRALLKDFCDYSGSIELNGIDIQKLSEKAIYNKIAIVPQENWIIDDSIYNNISMLTGFPSKDSEAYRIAINGLKLNNLVLESDDRPLGELGEGISGGESKRICLARALRRERGLVIFDEPTSGLDPESAAIINEFIFEMYDSTRIVITHDWSEAYLKRFDGIVNLGEIEAG